MHIEQNLRRGIYFSPDDKGGGPVNENPRALTDETILIGTSNYLLSREMQLQCALTGFSDYETTRSILTIGEPHHNQEAQFSLFQGLEIFFRDNPELIKKTIFLAEGFPINQPISVHELIEADPHPSDELIKETLGTFLITGYMAYEWKHQHGIPIVGTEHPELYALSREFATWYVENPNAKLADVFIMESETRGRVHTLSVEHGWTFAINVRNFYIASTLIDQSRHYENPMLFVGTGHLTTRQHDSTFDVLKQIAIEGVAQKSGIFGHYLRTIDPSTLENHAIHFYLQEKQIGYSALDPIGFPSKRQEMAYQKLFQAQNAGKNMDKTGIDYDGYLDWLLAKKNKSGRKTTVQPDPKAAAEFIKRLKKQEAGVVYEPPKTHDFEYDWFAVSEDKLKTTLQRTSLWIEKGINPRGRDFERIRTANLGSNCDVIDDYVLQARTVTSMKSMELRDKTYQNIKNVERKVKGYIDELSEFTELKWTNKKTNIYYDLQRGRDFQRYIELAIPEGKATQMQVEKLLELQEYAQTKDVTLVIIEVP